MRLGVIADTHGRPLPAEVRSIFQGVERILHAGDLGSLAVLDELATIAPVEAVAGNIDPPEVVSRLGRRKVITVAGVRIGLVHGDEGTARTTVERARHSFPPGEVAVIVFGHSHQPRIDWIGDLLLFNPGSATEPRLQPQPSVGILTLGERIGAEIVYLPRRGAA